MSDNAESVELLINDQRITNFRSYLVESHLYVADGAFRFELAQPDVRAQEGQTCEVWANGRRIMKGIADRITRRYSKNDGSSVTIEGRDYCGLLVDCYCERFPSLANKNLGQIALRLLEDVPFIDLIDIVYAVTNEQYDQSRAYTQIEPGTTVFEALNNASRARGMIFYCNESGTLVFSKPSGQARTLFAITIRDGTNSAKVLSGERNRDASKRYSKIIVLGQQQGTEDMAAGDINVRAVVTDNDAPIKKTFVEVINDDNESPRRRARMLLEKQKAKADTLTYRLQGHAQNGNNWAVNELVSVDDDVLDVHDTLLIYGRKFELSRENGTTVELQLGPPGVIE